MLEKRGEGIEQEKALSVEPAKSRYIPVKIQRLVEKEYGTKCSISTCKKPSEHTDCAFDQLKGERAALGVKGAGLFREKRFG